MNANDEPLAFIGVYSRLIEALRSQLFPGVPFFPTAIEHCNTQ